MEGRGDQAAGLIAGTPKGIRADEWLVQTPWTWSQAKQEPAFPATNRNVGNELAPLVTNLQFVFCSYPRFQIPLAYLAAALLAGGWASYKNRIGGVRKTQGYFLAGYLTFILMVAAAVSWRWFQEVSPTIQEIRSLIYPGQVISSGGSFPWYRFLAPFLEFRMTEDHYPQSLGNVCEASGFVLLAPLLAGAFIRDLWQRRIDGIFTALVLFLVFVISFMIWGVPMWLARSTGWFYVASSRAILAVGVASIIGLVRYLADHRPQSECKKSTLLIGALALSLALFACLYVANSRLANFAGLAEIIAVAVFFSLVFCLLWRRVQVASCILLLVPSLYTSGLVNPIGRGVPGLSGNSALDRLERIHRSDAQALWLVVADSASNQSLFVAQFVKATGANVLGGVRCMPDHEMDRVLDPENKYATVYDRFAGIYLIATPDGSPVFELLAPGHYQVRLPMQPHILESLGVRYLVLADRAAGMSVPGFEQIGAEQGLVVLRRR